MLLSPHQLVCPTGLSLVLQLACCHGNAGAQQCPDIYNEMGCPPEFTDESFHRQWAIEALRICEVWALSYDGDGIVIGIVDAGILESHPDLIGQVQPVDGGCSEPRPNFNDTQRCWLEDTHGTQLASIVAAVGGNDDNQLGENMVGVAYGASLAEVFLYDDSGGNPNSEQEHSQVISFKNDCIDVKVHAYDLEGEGPLPQYRELPSSVRTALSQAIIDGRAGRGQVFVWSAGNGATNGERTDYEELVSSRFTIATGAIDPSYSRVSSSETGSSLFCIAPGSHLIMADRVIDPPPCEPPPYEPSYSSCGPGAAGTSYSAPHVGGVVALMMHANANLAWRDVMDAIARTAATINPASGWQTNQAGIDHSYEYGHGLIDAYEAVSYVDPLINPAWKPLLYEREIIVPLDPDGMTVSPGQTKTLSVDAVANMRVEHVELEMDVTMAGVTGANVGPLEIEIERIWEPEIGEFGFGGGAHKTRSVFTVARTDPTPSYNGAVFTSVRHWGETGTATWKVILRNTSGNMTATWEGAQVRFYGAPKCIADWNMDEIADAADDLAYDEMYNEGDPAADLNGDRMVNGADLDLWEDVYYPAGCQ